MRQTNAITIFRKRASRVVLKCSSSEKNSRQLSDYIFWLRSHLWSSSGDITKQPGIHRELFTLAALSMTSLKWASSAMYWIIVLSYELFGNSRVEISLLPAQVPYASEEFIYKIWFANTPPAIYCYEFRLFWLKYSVEEFLLRFSSDYRFFCHSTVFIPLRIDKKLPENSAKTVKQSPFSLSLSHLVLILWHISSISDTGNAEKRSFALSATQQGATREEWGGFSGWLNGYVRISPYIEGLLSRGHLA